MASERLQLDRVLFLNWQWLCSARGNMLRGGSLIRWETGSLCSERLAKSLICPENPKDFSQQTEKKGEKEGRGLGRINRLKTLSVRPQDLSVFINNAVHIHGTSWPYTFFNNLRNRGSSPWVSHHFQWQQGRCPEFRVNSACRALLTVTPVDRLATLNLTDRKGIWFDFLWQLLAV